MVCMFGNGLEASQGVPWVGLRRTQTNNTSIRFVYPLPVPFHYLTRFVPNTVTGACLCLSPAHQTYHSLSLCQLEAIQSFQCSLTESRENLVDTRTCKLNTKRPSVLQGIKLGRYMAFFFSSHLEETNSIQLFLHMYTNKLILYTCTVVKALPCSVAEAALRVIKHGYRDRAVQKHLE